MKNKVLATLVDQNHLEYAKALFASAYFNGGWDGDFMVLSLDIPEEKLSWFKEKGIYIKQVKPSKEYNKPVSTWSHVLLSKIYLFEQDMKKWQQVVYLDVDCIVRADIRKLGSVKKIAGVPFYHRVENLIFKNNKINPKKIFSTGVFAFNTNLIKKDTVSILLNLVKDLHTEVPQGTKDFGHEELAFGLYFNKEIQGLPAVFNMIPILINGSVFAAANKKLKAIIVHCASPNPSDKPWQEDSIFYNEWRQNLNLSDKIDLKKSVDLVKAWPRVKVLFYSFWNINYKNIRLFYLDFDNLIGRTGLVIKEINPKIYNFLRKILKNEK